MRLLTKKSRKRLFACILSLVLLGSALTASAATQVPYKGYNYWENMSGPSSRKTVYSQPTHQVTQVISSSSLGVESFSGLTDIYSSGSNVYVLDGAASKILVLDKNYNLQKTITEVILDGTPISFKGAKGVYAKGDKLYICDTENGRVLLVNSDGVVEYKYEKPNSSLIPETFRYSPTAVEVDSQGNTYVLSEGSYYGIILFGSDREFIGFYGANKVKNGITDVLTNIIQRMFPNNAKKSASASALPYSMSDLSIDSTDFVYTVTGNTKEFSPKGQICRLNPGTGGNTLKTDSVNFVDNGVNTTSRTSAEGFKYQNLCSIDVDEQGFIYALDSTYGRIFVYDKDGKILGIFGGGFGRGSQKGTFRQANALSLNGDDILVCDGSNNTITVFRPTEIGSLILSAQAKTIKGDYAAAEDTWRSVLEIDSNCQAAYSGLARAELTAGNYKEAQELARKGYDRDTYSLAFEEIRTDFLDRNFWLIFGGVIVLAAALVTLIIVGKRRKITVIKNEEIQLMTSAMLHPSNTFTTIKEKKKGSLVIAGVLLAVYYVSTVLRELYGGFLFTYYDAGSFNSLWVLVKSAALVGLWIICNWLICSLTGGNGRLREIAIVTCYSLIPIILNNVLQLVLTNVLMTDEAAFLNIINTVAYLIFILMIAIGFMVIHDYGFGKFVGTSVLTILAMAIIVFLLILLLILVQQLTGFLSTLIMEFTMI